MLPSESAIWGWLARGLGGIATLVDRMADEKVRISDENLRQFQHEIERLCDAVTKAESLSQHTGQSATPRLTEDAQAQATSEQPGQPEPADGGRPAYASDWPTSD